MEDYVDPVDLWLYGLSVQDENINDAKANYLVAWCIYRYTENVEGMKLTTRLLLRSGMIPKETEKFQQQTYNRILLKRKEEREKEIVRKNLLSVLSNQIRQIAYRER